jgi:hypothetical protein
VFSSARTEHTALRVEHRLIVQGHESSGHLRRLDSAMTKLLLTSDGATVVRSFANIIDHNQVSYRMEYEFC